MQKTFGPYTVMRELGTGGMGTVYLARDANGDLAAVKSLRELAPHRMESIRREVELLKALYHPNIVRFLDEGLEDPEPWYAMEFIEGIPLRDMVDGDRMETLIDGADVELMRAIHRGHPDWRPLLKVISDVLSGLNAIHAVGVIHRDIKPENILVRPDHSAVLLDFGIAGRIAGIIDREELSDSSEFGATPAYAPPEQQAGESVDARADIYALGVTLYEVLTGQLPYQAKTSIAMYTAHLDQPVPLAHEVNPAIPPGLGVLAQRMMAKDPRDRPGYAIDVDLELRRVMGFEPPTYRAANYIYHPLFTGRGKELMDLKRFVQQTTRGSSLLATVRGVAGVGKTRLLQELLSDSGRQVQVVVVQSRGMNHAVGRAWDRFNLDRHNKLPPLPDDITNPETVEFMRVTLSAAARERPIVLVFDDAPNMDPESILSIGMLASGPVPSLSLILSMRSDDPETPEFSQMPVDLAIHLKELNRPEVEQVLRSMLGLQSVSETHLDFVMNHSQGNPFVVAELVRHAMDTGLLFRREGSWEFRTDQPIEVWQNLSVPARLARMYFQRLVRLQPEERVLLYALAVCGDGAPEAMVRTVSEGLRALPSLIEKEIIHPVDDGTLRLHQPRMVDVILQSMDPQKREIFEARANDWLRAFSAGRTRKLSPIPLDGA